MRRSTCLAFALTLVLSCSALAQEEPPARPPLAVPDSAWEGVERVPNRLVHVWRAGHRFSTTSRHSMTVERPGPAGTMTMEMIFVSDDVVVEAPEQGGATISSTYRDVVYEVAAGGRSFAIDTRDGTLRSGNPVVDAMALMVGAPLKVTIGPAGTVERVHGGPDVAARMLAGVPAKLREQLRAQFATSMSDEQLARQLQESYVVFPPEELQPGQTWTREYSMPLDLLGEVGIVAEYAYLGVVQRDGARHARLYCRIACAGAEERDIQLANGMPALASLSPFEGTGSLHVRLADGMVVDMSPRTAGYDVVVKVQGEEVRIHTEITAASSCVDAPTTDTETAPR